MDEKMKHQMMFQMNLFCTYFGLKNSWTFREQMQC